MNALTIKQPWAWAIAEPLKDFENRSWAPPKDARGQLIAIHAGKSFDREGYPYFIDIMDCLGLLLSVPMPEQYITGAVIAVARLGIIIEEWKRPCPDSPWFFGPYGWQMKDVVAIDPVPCRGMQGLWRLPAEVEAEVKQRMEAQR